MGYLGLDENGNMLNKHVQLSDGRWKVDTSLAPDLAVGADGTVTAAQMKAYQDAQQRAFDSQNHSDFLSTYGPLLAMGAVGGLALGGAGLAGGGEALGGAALDTAPAAGANIAAQSGTLGGTAVGDFDLTNFLNGLDSTGTGGVADGGLTAAQLQSLGLDPATLGETASPFTTNPSFSSLGGTAGASGSGLSDLGQQLLKSMGKNAFMSLLQSGVGGVSSLLASRTQAAAGNQANNTLLSILAQSQANQAPYMAAALPALGNLSKMTTPGYDASSLMTDPGAGYRYDLAKKALDNQLRAGGKFYSGQALFNTGKLAGDQASQEFGSAFNRNAALAGIGQTATNQNNNLTGTTGGQIAGNTTGIGNVRASGYTGVGNSIIGGINSYNSANQQDTLMALLPQLLGRA